MARHVCPSCPTKRLWCNTHTKYCNDSPGHIFSCKSIYLHLDLSAVGDWCHIFKCWCRLEIQLIQAFLIGHYLGRSKSLKWAEDNWFINQCKGARGRVWVCLDRPINLCGHAKVSGQTNILVCLDKAICKWQSLNAEYSGMFNTCLFVFLMCIFFLQKQIKLGRKINSLHQWCDKIQLDMVEALQEVY